MIITIDDLKSNIDKYLNIAIRENIYIENNGKMIAMFSNPNKNKFEILKSLEGIIPSDVDVNEYDIKKEKVLT